jgi:cytochrome c biogenesis protein CcdA
MIIAIFTALWLGILTAISPCPLATNIAAISFTSKNIECPFKTVYAGFLYVLGRILTYVVLGFIVVGGLLAIPSIANFLQHSINKFIGPILIIVGLILLKIIKLNFSVGVNHDRFKEFAETSSFLGAFLLGVIFALSFCPVSAALFFGSLTSLAIEHHSRLMIPAMYGIGTGLPVVIFAIVIAFSMHKLSEIYHNVVKFETWFRRITGGIFIIAGIYFIIIHFI